MAKTDAVESSTNIQSGNNTVIWNKGGDFSPPCPGTINMPISSM
jgi:hypothetical protein